MTAVSMKKLTDFGTKVLVAKGLPRREAKYIAQMAVTTEAMGITTHGLRALQYAVSVVPDPVMPDLTPDIVKQTSAMILVDAHMGLSQPAVRLALKAAARKARKNGIAMAAIRNGRWIGALAPYVYNLAREGLMVQAWAQSSQCKDCAPVGGIDGRFSTNPMAIAFPTHADPVFADMSTASVSMGQFSTMAKKGERAADKIFLDPQGHPTDDPRVFKQGGTVLFTGGAYYGHKGYALSLWCEALTVMAGGPANHPDLEQRQGLNFLVIDPSVFGDMAPYRKEMDRFTRHVRSSRLRPGHHAIRLPGERALAALLEADEKGVPLSPETLVKLNELAQAAGLKPLT
ncbi:MAG: Ldh family oxidoreductase [Planctomycetota bacterium]